MAGLDEKTLFCFVCCCMLPAFILSIAASSWMVHIRKKGEWKETLNDFYASNESQVANRIIESWETSPFVDIQLLPENQSCGFLGEKYDDVVFDHWYGTRAMCDCLERAGDREYYLDMTCQRGKNAPHNSEDCIDVAGAAPIVIDKFNGVRVCGLRADYNYRNIQRPVLQDG